MENSVEKPAEGDITTERYKGPGPAVTSLGYGFIDFKLAFFTSLAVGIGVALAAPKQVVNFFKSAETGSHEWLKSGSLLKQIPGWIGTNWINAGNWAANDLPFKSRLKSLMRSTPENQRWEATAKTAGVLTVFSFFATFFTGGGRGIHVAHAGRDQFHRAKSEVKELRAENVALRQKYAELKVAHESEPAITPAEITADTDAARREPMPQTTIQKSEANVSEPALADALAKQAEATASL